MPDFYMGARDLNPSTFTDWALSPVSQHNFKILIENIEFQNNVKVIAENYWEGGRERSKKITEKTCYNLWGKMNSYTIMHLSKLPLKGFPYWQRINQHNVQDFLQHKFRTESNLHLCVCMCILVCVYVYTHVIKEMGQLKGGQGQQENAWAVKSLTWGNI